MLYLLGLFLGGLGGLASSVSMDASFPTYLPTVFLKKPGFFFLRGSAAVLSLAACSLSC